MFFIFVIIGMLFTSSLFYFRRKAIEKKVEEIKEETSLIEKIYLERKNKNKSEGC